MTLFEPEEPRVDPAPFDPGAPLAARMRPRTLDEVVGQDHLLAPGSPLRRLVEGDAPMSLILFGPPGTGKTTLALIVSSATNRRFEQLSALNAGVKDVREVIARAKSELGRTGRQTVLFIDEIHRFSKTQQDSLLGAVEARHVTLVAATTENPFFSIVSPLLSRSLLLTLQPLDERRGRPTRHACPGRRARAERRGHARRRRPRAPAAHVRRRRPPRAHRPRSGRRDDPGRGAHRDRPADPRAGRRHRGRALRPRRRSALRRDRARSSSRSAGRTPTRRCTISPG